MFKNILLTLSLVLVCNAFAQNINLDSDNRRADTYRRSDAMQEGSATTCRVVQTRVVTMEVGNTAKIVGATAGGLIGVAAAQSRNSNAALATLGGSSVQLAATPLQRKSSLMRRRKSS